MIRPATPADAPDILALAETSGLFDADGIGMIAEMLGSHDAGHALWLIADDDGPVGVVYCVPEPMTDRAWNVLMLIVGGDQHGKGHGRALMQAVEDAVVEHSGRLLLVETSGTGGYERARAFYPACGYTEAARVPDFYADGDDKVVFTKSLATASA